VTGARLQKHVQSQADSGPDLPDSWYLLDASLRKPFWTVAETMLVMGKTRSTIDRWRDDPNSGFPAGRVASPGKGKSRNKGTVWLPALQVLRFMEGSD
tara:strand:+ start:457 stop:750 length:294 start_codon:yes stop_codon:yes gene_type:complete